MLKICAVARLIADPGGGFGSGSEGWMIRPRFGEKILILISLR